MLDVEHPKWVACRKWLALPDRSVPCCVEVDGRMGWRTPEVCATDRRRSRRGVLPIPLPVSQFRPEKSPGSSTQVTARSTPQKERWRDITQ